MTVVEELKQKNGLIDAAVLAPLLGIPKDKLYKKTKAGEVPHYRLLGRVKYDPHVIAEWMRQRGLDLADEAKSGAIASMSVRQGTTVIVEPHEQPGLDAECS